MPLTVSHHVTRHMDCHLGIEVEELGPEAGEHRYRAWLTVDRLRTGVSTTATDVREAEESCRRLVANGLTRLLTPTGQGPSTGP
jgi:hypothetical protein